MWIIVKRAVKLWWQHAVHLTFFNVAWLVLQLLIVTGPPATAALYIIVYRFSEGELVTIRDGWLLLRQMFIPAWKWGAANLLVAVIVIGNLWLARNQPGELWVALRVLWTAAGLFWLALSLLYWPLWISEAEQTFRNTLRNSLVLFLNAPVLVLAMVLLSLIILVLSAATAIPLINWAMAWVASLGLYTSQTIVEKIKQQA